MAVSMVICLHSHGRTWCSLQHQSLSSALLCASLLLLLLLLSSLPEASAATLRNAGVTHKRLAMLVEKSHKENRKGRGKEEKKIHDRKIRKSKIVLSPERVKEVNTIVVAKVLDLMQQPFMSTGG